MPSTTCFRHKVKLNASRNMKESGHLQNSAAQLIQKSGFIRVEFMRQVIACLLAIFVSVPVISQQPRTPDVRERLTPEAFAQQVQSLEQRVKSKPEDADAREALLRLYGTESLNFMPLSEASKAVRPHGLWLIEHQPHSYALAYTVAFLMRQVDPEGYQQAAALWTKQVEQAPDDPVVLQNAGFFYANSDRARAEELFVRILQFEPGQTSAASTLTSLYELDEDQATTPEQKAAIARKRVAVMANSLDQANAENRFDGLISLAQAELDANDLVRAEKDAHELLDSSSNYKKQWNYGNAIHQGNLILGRIRLRQGQIADAKDYLLAAGRTPGSPQLDSFGPNMTLAKELLEKGERDVVLEYFDLCSKFWQMGQDKLNAWRAAVKQSKIPEFGGNLKY
jgi:tetratricopeptide (TPR) repeat protein